MPHQVGHDILRKECARLTTSMTFYARRGPCGLRKSEQKNVAGGCWQTHMTECGHGRESVNSELSPLPHDVRFCVQKSRASQAKLIKIFIFGGVKTKEVKNDV